MTPGHAIVSQHVEVDTLYVSFSSLTTQLPSSPPQFTHIELTVQDYYVHHSERIR
jgi:hypothetical protein